MKLSYREMVSSIAALNVIAQASFTAIVGAYRISRNIDKINDELKHFQKAADVAFKKYATDKDENDSPVVPEKKMPKYSDEMDAVLDEEVEVDILTLEFDLFDGVKISPGNYSAMSFMIIEPQESTNEQIQEEIPEPQPDGAGVGDKE